MIGLNLYPNYTLADLRRKHPDWRWSAQRRNGLGWDYSGFKGDRSVCVTKEARFSQDMEGEYEFSHYSWFAVESGQRVALWDWSKANAAHGVEIGKGLNETEGEK